MILSKLFTVLLSPVVRVSY